MGSCISAIYDDYDDYKYMCKELSIEPLAIRSSEPSFMEHESSIYKGLGINNFYDFIDKNKKNANK